MVRQHYSDLERLLPAQCTAVWRSLWLVMSEICPPRPTVITNWAKLLSLLVKFKSALHSDCAFQARFHLVCPPPKHWPQKLVLHDRFASKCLLRRALPGRDLIFSTFKQKSTSQSIQNLRFCSNFKSNRSEWCSSMIQTWKDCRPLDVQPFGVLSCRLHL